MTAVPKLSAPAAEAAAASRPLSLGQNFSWTFIGTGISSACNWAMLAVLAKLGTVEMVGLYTLALAISQPIMVFAQLHLRTVQATDAVGQFDFRDYMGLRLLMTCGAWVVIAATAAAAGFDALTGLVLLAVGADIAFDSISDVVYGLLQRHERMDRIAISMMLRGVVTLVGLAAGFLLSRGVLGAALGAALGSAAVLLAYDLPSGAWILRATAPAVRSGWYALVPRWRVARLARLFWLALPMGVTTMLNSVNVNVSRYLIALYLGDRELGIFAASASLIGIGRVFVAALGQAAYPRLSQHYAAGHIQQFRRLLLRLIAVAALVGVGGLAAGLVAGRQILTLLFRAEYAQQLDVFYWLLIGGVLVYIANALGVGLTAARFFQIQVPLAIFGILAIAVCSWLLIPSGGLTGAAVATALASTLSAVAIFVILYGVLRNAPTVAR